MDKLINLNSRYFRGSKEIKKILDEIFKIHQKNINTEKLLILAKSIELFYLILKLQKNGTQNNLANDIKKTTNYIKNHLNQQLTIELLAKKLNLSESWFKQKFKQETGIPPNEYIQRMKIKEAKKILQKNNKISITDISCQLRFSSSEYFSVVFKKFTGKTPTEYKKRSRNN